MAQNKGHIGKLYRFAIRRQFLKLKHPSFDNRWFTVLKWDDRMDENKIKSELEKNGINSNTQRAGLREYLSIPNKHKEALL